MVTGFENYLRRSIDASKQAMDSIGELDELLETGFRGKEVDLVEKMLAKLNVLEHETDEMQVSLRQQLFAIEDTLKPVDVVFLYKIIERVGGLADKAQQAGYQLQLLLAD
jgi:predicted phosphate transport protein (TIGR00153 family)